MIIFCHGSACVSSTGDFSHDALGMLGVLSAPSHAVSSSDHPIVFTTFQKHNKPLLKEVPLKWIEAIGEYL